MLTEIREPASSAKRCLRPQPKRQMFRHMISGGSEKAIPRNAGFPTPPAKTLIV